MLSIFFSPGRGEGKPGLCEREGVGERPILGSDKWDLERGRVKG